MNALTEQPSRRRSRAQLCVIAAIISFVIGGDLLFNSEFRVLGLATALNGVVSLVCARREFRRAALESATPQA
jgi:hypothetical protein